MELRQLQYFMQICESGSILKAANNLYITQQAVSKSIAALERELGASLFYRTAKGVVLTQFGQELRKNCLPVMVSMENLNRNMEKALRFNSGKLRIGVSGGLMFLNSKRFGLILRNYTLIFRLRRRSMVTKTVWTCWTGENWMR